MTAADATREHLLTAAKTLFSQKGFAAVTVREIAEAAHANLSLVSYYFGGKEGIYRACFDAFTQARLEAAERILKNPESEEEFRLRLKMFCEELFYSHLAEPDLMTLIHRECEAQLPLIEDIFRLTFLKIFETLRGFLAHAQSQKWISPDLNLQFGVMHFFSLVFHPLKSDHILKRYFGQTLKDSAYAENLIRSIIVVYLNGIKGTA